MKELLLLSFILLPSCFVIGLYGLAIGTNNNSILECIIIGCYIFICLIGSIISMFFYVTINDDEAL